MLNAMPRYEVRFNGNEEWEEISDVELVERLYKFYRKVTPAIREMISGEVLRTPDAVYRLKCEAAILLHCNPVVRYFRINVWV